MLRVGIVGMGFGADVHLPAFEEQSDVEVAAVADNGSGRAKELAAKRGGKLRAFNDGMSLAAWDGIDIVSIAVPPSEQEALVRAALIAGKHVLCEKPFCLGANAANELSRLAHERRLTGALFYEFRYDPGIKRLIEMVNAGEIGKVRHLAVTWQTSGALDPQRVWSWRHDAKQGGGVLIDWFSHVADYASQIIQSPVRSVWARATTIVPERFDRNMVKRKVSAPDECDVVCEFKDGVTSIFSVSSACRAPVGHRIEVSGERGSIVFHHAPPFSGTDRSLWLVRSNSEEGVVDCLLPSSVPSSDGRFAAATELIADFTSVLRGGCSPLLPTFADGVANWRIIEAAVAAVDDESMHTIGTEH
jgi:predicted dehydrogenase